MHDQNRTLILAQLYQALGQGTGPVRVRRQAARALRARYLDLLTDGLVAHFDAHAPQVLERIRAIGRLAAHKMATQGRTALSADDMDQAMLQVEDVSATSFCPPEPARRSWRGSMSASTAEDEILAQLHVALGQGSAALPMDREALLAMEERYRPIITAALCARWEEVGVQLLERLRAVGRLAAHLAACAGRVSIAPQDFLGATLRVEAQSGCPWCPGARRPAPAVDGATATAAG